MYRKQRRPAWAGLMMLLPLAAGASLTADDLGWLTGCWHHDGAEAGSVEIWSSAAGGTLFGLSRSVRGGKTVAFEYLRIVPGADGSLRYVASPSGQATAAFELAASDSTSVTFENAQHDFPQRIRYERLSDQRLLATISGTMDGLERKAHFAMSRCSDETE